VRAARDGDAGAVRSIVELLDSDDPAVRLAAIEALERLTSDTRGYRHYDAPGRRSAAIEEWVQALEPVGAEEPPTSQERGPRTDG
jgi:HEAT repeat protein